MKGMAIATMLGVALAAALPLSASAGSKQEFRSKPARVVTQARPQKKEAESCGDPYWDCCLSYYRGWGPGACGR